jgi:hypothetical protein
MSLYREAGGRSLLPMVATGVFCLLVGGLVGLLIGSSGEEEPSLEDAVSEVRDEVQPALSALELVTIEYPEAVSGGEVVAETEYQAAVDQVKHAEEAVDGVAADLELLAPRELERAQAALDELARSVQAKAPAEEVTRLANEAAAALRAATRARDA